MGQPDVSDVHEPGMMDEQPRKRKRKRKKGTHMMPDGLMMSDEAMMKLATLEFPETMGIDPAPEDVYGVVYDLAKKSKWKSPEAERPSLKWPHLYDILRSQGMDKEKAARISNSRRGRRRKGRLSTGAGRAAAKARRAAKMSKSLGELIDKYNPNHGRDGKFASGSGGGGSRVSTEKRARVAAKMKAYKKPKRGVFPSGEELDREATMKSYEDVVRAYASDEEIAKWSDESRAAALKARRRQRRGARSGRMIRRLRRIHNMRGPRGRYKVARQKVNRS